MQRPSAMCWQLLSWLGRRIVCDTSAVALVEGETCLCGVCWAEPGPVGRSSREEVSGTLGRTLLRSELYVTGGTSLTSLEEFKHCLGHQSVGYRGGNARWGASGDWWSWGAGGKHRCLGKTPHTQPPEQAHLIKLPDSILTLSMP